jgi:DNA mismatch repair ATPase MutL
MKTLINIKLVLIALLCSLVLNSCTSDNRFQTRTSSTDTGSDSMRQWRSAKNAPLPKKNEPTTKQDEKAENKFTASKSQKIGASKSNLKHPEAVNFLLGMYKKQYPNLLKNPPELLLIELDAAVEHYLTEHFNRTKIDFDQLDAAMNPDVDPDAIVIVKKK